MIKKITIFMMTIILSLSMASCKAKDILTGEEMPNKEWDLIENSANGSTVNLYITELDEEMKTWLSKQFSRRLLEEQNITLNIKMLEFSDILTTLKKDVLNEVTSGQLDLLILKDDGFSKLKAQGYLYEKITEKIPNATESINNLDLEINSEHGVPLDGFGITFTRNQFVLMFDEDELESFPLNKEELIKFIRENKNKFSYPNPTKDKTGSQFVRTLIYEIIDKDIIMKLLNPDLVISELELYNKLKPAFDYLIELDKFVLKNNGEYFTKITEIDELFTEGELFFSMSSDFTYAETAIDNGTYPDGARSFIFENGTIGDTKYLGIPLNASNKSGSLVVINEILSLDMQLSKYNPLNWGSLPVIDLNLLSKVDAEKFKKVSIKRNTLRVEELLSSRYPELPMNIKKMINKLWNEHVNLGK